MFSASLDGLHADRRLAESFASLPKPLRSDRAIGARGRSRLDPRRAVGTCPVEQVTATELLQEILQLSGVEVVGQAEKGEQRTQLVAVELAVGQLLEQTVELADVELTQTPKRARPGQRLLLRPVRPGLRLTTGGCARRVGVVGGNGSASRDQGSSTTATTAAAMVRPLLHRRGGTGSWSSSTSVVSSSALDVEVFSGS